MVRIGFVHPHRSTTSLLLRRALPVGVTFAIACGSASEPGSGSTPTPGPGLTILGAKQITDTIDSWHVKSLIFELRDASGAVVPNAQVHIDGDTTSGTGRVTMIVGNPEYAASSQIVTTNAQGRDTVSVFFGGRVGNETYNISAPNYGSSASVTYSILPGHAFSIAVPGDTAIFLGDTLRPDTYPVDAGGNRLGGTVSTSSTNTAIIANSNGGPVGVALGVANVVFSAGAARSITVVAVVPRLTIASAVGTLRTMGLNGANVVVRDSGLQNPGELPAPVAHWHPTQDIVYYEKGGAGGLQVWASPAGAAPHPVFPAGTFWSSKSPMVSPDGQWLYFSAQTAGGTSYRLWRSHLDGSAIAQLAPVVGLTDFGEWYPEISPDGTTLLFSADINGDILGQVFARDLTTGVIKTLPMVARTARWSPAGDLIAYLGESDSRLHVIRPDGTGDRTVSTALFDTDPTWTPDGKFLLALHSIQEVEYLTLVDITTGALITMEFMAQYDPAVARPQ